jgi:adenylate kinase
MLREAVKDGSSLGKEAAGFMNRGELVPDAVVTGLVVSRMAKPDAASGVILDGYPRTIKQAESLDASLIENGKKIDKVLYFGASEDVIIQRLAGRRACKCGKTYHLTNMPSKKEGVCDVCGGALYQREDDKPETVKKRLAVYEKSTKDLVEYYRKKDLLTELDGGNPADKLFEEIKALFKKEGLA